MSSVAFPRLRPIDARPIAQRGQPALLLRDPLSLSDRCVVLPRRFAPLLALCDGTRDSSGLRASLMIRHGIRVSTEDVDRIVRGLDEALLLDNERYWEAAEVAREAFRSGPSRAPVSAGASYPADADELRAMLDGYITSVGASDGAAAWRGLVSPHIDFARGGEVYARVWERVADMAQSAEVVVIVGTDHTGREGSITLTKQHYATPYGVLPTDGAAVERIASAVGSESAFADELHHRSEHSIELAAVWLHHIRSGKACRLVPILCGSFGAFMRDRSSPARDDAVGGLIGALADLAASRAVLLVAAADLAHVGPAFGGHPVDLTGRARVRAADDELIACICSGDAEGVFRSVCSNEGRYNVCGLAPAYVVLRALAPSAGEQVAYAQCPADGRGTSIVSICGVALQ